MSTIADQLFQAAESAAANAGGGGDDNTPPNAGGYKLVQRDGYYVALDNSGKEIARSQDQNTAMQRAKSYLRNPPSPVQAQPSEAMAPGAEVSENPVIPQQNYPTNPYQLNQQLQPVQPRQPGQFDATPMQTRMPQASTIDPAQAVLQGAAQTAGAAAVTPQGTTTATTGAVPGQEAPEEQRRRGRSSWEAPGEAVQFTQEDFYPNPQDPFAGQYSTGVEYVARQGRMPMGALSKAAAALQDRQLQLDQKRQEFIDDLYKPIKTASPYQQNFNAIVNKQREDFVKSVADAYTGGDVNKAYREIFASPQLRNQWRQINADLEALGQRGGEIFARAEKYLADAATNTIGSTPEMRKLARDIMYGMGGYASPDGTGGDFNTLIKNIKQFEMMEGRDRYFRDTVTKSVKDFAERLPYTADGQKPYVITPEKRYRFITQGHRQTFINQIKQIARDMAVYQGYGEGADLTARIADNEKFLMAMLPDQYDLNTTVEDTYANISRGSGDGGQKSVYNFPYQKINPQKENFANVRAAMKDAGFNLPEGTTTLDSVSFQEVTGGKAGVPKVIPIEGTSVIPLGAFRDFDGKIWLYAKEAKLTGVVKSGGKDGEAPQANFSGDDVAQMITSGDVEISSLPTKLYPFDRYEDIVRSKFGITGQQINDIIEGKNPRRSRAQAQPAGTRPTGGRTGASELN